MNTPDRITERALATRWLTEQQILALFFIYGFKAESAFEIRNQYWPDAAEYDQERWPWWLVKTEFGLIEFGWRKRVISIDWKDCKMACDVTDDDVTKGDTDVHAYGYPDAIKYLTQLCRWLNTTPEGYERYRTSNSRP